MAKSASLMGATAKLIRSVMIKLNLCVARFLLGVVLTCAPITPMLIRVARLLNIAAPAKNVTTVCRKLCARKDVISP